MQKEALFALAFALILFVVCDRNWNTTVYQYQYRRRRPTLLLVIEFIKIKIKRRPAILFRKTRPYERTRRSARIVARNNCFACGGLGKISGRNYLSGEKVTSFQLSVSTLFASSLCIDRPAPFARCYSLGRYKLFNLRMNGEILPGTQTREI